MTGWVKAKDAKDSIMREGFEAFSEEIRVIKQGLYALLSRDGGQIEMVKKKLRDEFDEEEVQLLLITQKRNLAKLQQREAKSGGQAELKLLNRYRGYPGRDRPVGKEVSRMKTQADGVIKWI